MSFTTCWELLMASYSSAALLNVGDDGYIFLNLEIQSNSMQFQDCWNNDIIQSPSATVNVVLFVETLDKYGFIWFTLVFFRCHHCSYRHDISREAPLCAVCIVTWNFSFELVLFCFVWTEAVRGPCINNCAAKTTPHALRWAQPYSTIRSHLGCVKNTVLKMLCVYDIEGMKNVSLSLV